MRAFIKLNKGLLKMPMQWKVWLMMLVTFNMIVPFFYLAHMEARIALGTIMISMMLMTMITHFSGFTRLLGFGHVFWFPMLYFFWTRLSQVPADNFYGIWLRTLMILNTGSLFIDVVDVSRYFSGHREETVPGL